MGYYTAFLIKRSQLRKEMKSFIKSEAGTESLQKLVIPIDQYATSVNFIEENEFIYNGELFDVVRKETSNNNIIIFCINDTKEQVLLNMAREHFSRNHDQNNSTDKSSSITKNIITEALPENPSFMISSVSKIMTGFDYASHMITQYIPVISHPPKG